MPNCKNCYSQIPAKGFEWPTCIELKMPVQDVHKNKKGLDKKMPGDYVYNGDPIPYVVMKFCCNAPRR
jgi:hypothetical protein